MDPCLELEQYLHKHIPLSQSMQVHVKQLNHHLVVLSAPIGPNINHRDTVFGGSACALGILSSWSLIHFKLQEEAGIQPRIVIQRNTMEYKKPILSTFEAHCCLEDEKAWDKFLNGIRKKGIGRIQLTSRLYCRDEEVGEFQGTFVTFDINR